MLRFLPPMLLCLLSACASTSPPSVEALSPGKTDIAFVSATPPLSGPLSRSAGFTVRLKYFLAGSGEDAYYITPQFDTFLPGRTTSGVPDREHTRYPKLTSRSGEVELFVPLSEILQSTNISRPYRVRFYLTKATGDTTRSVEATTKTYELNVAAP